MTDTKKIEVSVLRVSPDGKLIEFILKCPTDYHFTDFIINVDGSNDYYSIKDSVFGADTDSVEGAFEVASVGGLPGLIYHITLKAEIDDSAKVTGQIYDPLEESVWISDVSEVYKCLINDIIAFDANCKDTAVLDRVIRNYLMLYGHLEALKLGYLDEARDWFGKMKNCFSKCGTKPLNHHAGCGCHRPQPSCGCHK